MHVELEGRYTEMPFGKYMGEMIGTLPNTYLEWLIVKCTCWDVGPVGLKATIREELVRREQSGEWITNHRS
jgi:uncharacterized protein (DUF3820 family)